MNSPRKLEGNPLRGNMSAGASCTTPTFGNPPCKRPPNQPYDRRMSYLVSHRSTIWPPDDSEGAWGALGRLLHFGGRRGPYWDDFRTALLELESGALTAQIMAELESGTPKI